MSPNLATGLVVLAVVLVVGVVVLTDVPNSDGLAGVLGLLVAARVLWRQRGSRQSHRDP